MDVDAVIAAARERLHRFIDRYIDRRRHFKNRSDGAKRGWIKRRASAMQPTQTVDDEFRPFAYADNFDNWWNGRINDAGEIAPDGTLARVAKHDA